MSIGKMYLGALSGAELRAISDTHDLTTEDVSFRVGGQVVEPGARFSYGVNGLNITGDSNAKTGARHFLDIDSAAAVDFGLRHAPYMIPSSRYEAAGRTGAIKVAREQFARAREAGKVVALQDGRQAFASLGSLLVFDHKGGYEDYFVHLYPVDRDLATPNPLAAK